MPTFYQRPLTWLLVGVFVVFDSFLFFHGKPFLISVWGSGAILCQIYLLSAFSGQRQVYWLLRLAVVVFVLPTIAWLIRTVVEAEGQRGMIGGELVMQIVITVFLSSSFGYFTIRAIRRNLNVSKAQTESKLRWQVSVMELLALTLVVAIACAVLRNHQFSNPLKEIGVFHLLINVIPGVYLAIVLGNRFAMFVSGLILLAIGVCYFGYSGFGIVTGFQDNLFSGVLLGVCMFVSSLEPELGEAISIGSDHRAKSNE